jgi:tetratricopeptide (TPR) repeat protein
MKTKYKLMVGLCSLFLVIVLSVDADQILSADDLRGQATILYKGGQADKAFVVLRQARDVYEKILDSVPDDSDALQGLAMTLFDLGEYDAANDAFKKAGVEVDVKSFDKVVIVSNEVVAISNVVSVQSVEVPLSSNTVTVTNGDLTADSDITEVIPEKYVPEEPVVKLAEVPLAIHGIELSPNLVYDDRLAVMAENITSFADRAVEMKVNTVFVNAFARPNAKGAYGSAYFSNTVLPVKSSIMKLITEELAARSIAVYAVMPLLSFELPDTDSNNAMLVMSMRAGFVQPSVSWRKRLSPFNTNSISLITQVYSDLVKNVPLNGIVFGDDAFLTDVEDLNPAALNVYSNKLGINKIVLSELTPEQRSGLVSLRTEQLDILCETIMEMVKKDFPDMEFIRTLYAAAINHPPSEEWLAQNYKKALQIYSRVAVLADPELEDARSRGTWIRRLSECVVAEPSGIEKTIFRLPNYSNVQRRWISEHQQAKLLRVLSKAGINNFVLGPDDYISDRPRLKKAKRLF